MKEITLFNDSASQMSVMALGKAIAWNPKTTLIVSEKEGEILLKYDHIKKYEDISSDGGEKLRILEAEIESLKKENETLKAEIESLKPLEESLDREVLKAKAKELGIEFAKNIKTEELDKLIKDKQAE